MKPLTEHEIAELAQETPINVSRRNFLLSSAGVAAGALVLSVGIPLRQARAAAATNMAPGTRVPAFLQITPDNRIILQSPFVEGGQGIFTAMAQIVGEELDAEPARFIVENAPTGADYQVMVGGPGRMTGGSMSVRTSYQTMRKLGALARQLMLQAAANQWQVPLSELITEPGMVLHKTSNRTLSYGELASKALDLPVPDPDTVSLKDPQAFRWIGKGIDRVDVYEKSVGKANYTIDLKVDGMLHAAVQHAPRLGLVAGDIRNLQQVQAMPGVHSVHKVTGAVAVVAPHWWDAKRAAEALQVDWQAATSQRQGIRSMPADFSSEAFSEMLANRTEAGKDAETAGDVSKVFSAATPESVISATYQTQYVHHAQLEPPSTIAQFHDDGRLEIWLPNQAPDMFLRDIAKRAGIAENQIILHSPILGGFFGRHFLYPDANPYPQAIELAKATGKPIKLIWSREEEFLRDPLRPMAAVRMKAAIENGVPTALEVISACEGPGEAISGHDPDNVDGMAVEGLTGKSYQIANVRIAQDYVENPTMLAYWRSVGNSMNDFVYECFFDEMADKAGADPYELRKALLKDDPRLSHLLETVVKSAGGWKRGPFTAADGSKRARGIAMASPFGSHTATIAEVSIEQGQVKVHEIWEAIDPGTIVNPAIIEAQVKSAVALGLSQVLLEEVIYQQGEPLARNYDMYPILPPHMMPKVHVSIVESGAPMGGIGEPGLPPVPPAVVNAVSQLLGRRIRRMPLSRETFA
ncbi:xanthine dehydrogenase family protein molybdopterin-binding subunit [Shewanella sp. A3A]|nr:xanthine dehydrogenase family protein molybdopterin-binding subunit [Shewanella ferrihydritica]